MCLWTSLMVEGMQPISLSFAGRARSKVALLEFRCFGFVWCLIELARDVWFTALFGFF